LANEALAAPAGEVDGWGDSPAPAPGAEATDAATPDAADKKDSKDKDGKDAKKDDDDDDDANKKTLGDYLLDQAEKKKALEAIVKSLTPQTTITEEEKKALSKFTLFENPQAVKPEAPKPVAAPKPAVAAAAAPAVTVATGFRVAGSRVGGRGGRFEGQPRDNTGAGAARPGGQRKGGRGPQKILKGKNEFPDLGRGSSTTK